MDDRPDSLPLLQRPPLPRPQPPDAGGVDACWPGPIGCVKPDFTSQRLQHARCQGDLLIGLAWPLQDPKHNLRIGMELAMDEINAAGGVLGRRLRLKVADDERSVGRGMVIAEQFASDPAMVVVLVHLDTYVATQVAPTYMFNGMLTISPGAMGLELTRKGFDKVFRTYSSEDLVATVLALVARVAQAGDQFLVKLAARLGVDAVVDGLVLAPRRRRPCCGTTINGCARMAPRPPPTFSSCPWA